MARRRCRSSISTDPYAAHGAPKQPRAAAREGSTMYPNQKDVGRADLRRLQSEIETRLRATGVPAEGQP